jgi:hypothetical protein
MGGHSWRLRERRLQVQQPPGALVYDSGAGGSVSMILEPLHCEKLVCA